MKGKAMMNNTTQFPQPHLDKAERFTRGTCVSREPRRSGLTVLEVLFSMAIMLAGLMGVAMMVPFAGRQASESYKIAHGLASGSNTLSVFSSDHFILPRGDRPWQLIDDEYTKGSPNIAHGGWPAFTASGGWALVGPYGATNKTFYPSLERLYDGTRAKVPSLYRYHLDKVLADATLGALSAKEKLALAQNRALGQAFCIDPLFYAEQFGVPAANVKLGRGAWGNLRRNRFPFYDESFPGSMNPLEYPRSSEFKTPRMMRSTYRDPSLPVSGSGPTWEDMSWMRGDAAKMTSTMESRDLVFDKAEDGSVTRQFNALETGMNYNAVIKSVDSGTMISWLATVVPADGTPLVNPLSLDTTTTANIPGMEFFPESYQVSVVVFGRRNIAELATPELRANNYAGFHSIGAVPQSERLAKVTDLSVDSASSGTFEVELSAFSNGNADDLGNVSARLVVGDWILLSRYVYDNPLATAPASTPPIRELHKWYRIVGVTGLERFPRRVRVAGAPWDWSTHELDAIKRGGGVVAPYVDPNKFPTVATLLSDVVTVYQRTMTMGR